MAIALGLPCEGALVICADEQVSVPGGDRYQEERIASVELFGSAVVSSYGGHPGVWKEAWEKIGQKVAQIQGPDEDGDVSVTPHSIYESADEVFTAMGRPASLQMLIAIGGIFDAPE